MFLGESFKGEAGYLELLSTILARGTVMPDRTGVGCYKVFDAKLIWEGFPSSTVRPMGLRYAWEEMRLFLSGYPNTKVLEEQGIMFWKGNTSREFLDSRGMHKWPEGSLGKSYSHQWRFAGADSTKNGVDQLANLVAGLKDDPYSRRHAVDLWGVSEQRDFPLLPCWYRWSFFVEQTNGVDTLHLKTHSRSCDLLFGMTQHSTQAYMFLMALADLTGMQVGKLVHDFIDVHIYNNQVEYVEEVLERDLGVGGVVELVEKVNTLDDLINLPVTAFHRMGYKPNREKFSTPLPEMAI